MVLMKSTKVQNPRRIPRIKPIMRIYWPSLVPRPFTKNTRTRKRMRDGGRHAFARALIL